MSIEEIRNICLKYNIKNYTINDDLSIDVDDDLYLYNKGFKELPLKFGNVTGSFNFSYNKLTTLKGAPIKVGRHFDCSYNDLTSLEGAPSKVGDNFNCYDNPLESLKGIPFGIDKRFLGLPREYTYSDYLDYSNRVKRDLKFKKILKCQ